MGAQLVAAATVYAFPRCRTHAARTALTVMALTALDGDDQPTYWGGSERLEIAFGGPNEATRHAVMRAIRELRELGFISQDPAYRKRQHNRRWLLWISAAPPASGRTTDVPS